MVAVKNVPENSSASKQNITIPSLSLQEMRKELWSASDADSPASTTSPDKAMQGPTRQPIAEPSTSANHAAPRNPSEIPSSLLPGARPSPLAPMATGSSQSSLPKTETNPFLRKMWESGNEDTSKIVVTPEDSLAALNLEGSDSNPWRQQTQDSRKTNVPNIMDSDPWGDTLTTSHSPVLIPLPSEMESSVWEAQLDKGKARALDVSAGMSGAAPGERLDDWSLIDHDPQAPPAAPLAAVSSLPSSSSSTGPVDLKEADEPPQRPGKEPETVPTISPPSVTVPEPSRAQIRPLPTDAKENTYHIKEINWYDVNSGSTNLRTSPVLLQNANGPCPLVALVNALILTTPVDEPDAVLTQVLRSREQISLNLLLDAVLDELMSPRRTRPDAPLPDVTELYAFLQSLHTGMNVNPRFVAPPEEANRIKRASLSHIHPSQRSNYTLPGGFENTREMQLYATFSVPLLHGWLPPTEGDAYASLSRRAASYEDVQHLLFQEEDLEKRLFEVDSSGTGLSQDERSLYQDILTIKSFLSTSATQLTPWGIDVIGQAMEAGTVAILFRNDHFSTLYKHPETMELLTLVTDAGIASHEEIVWESLVDVNGENAEFFSGDFRLVSGGSASTSETRLPGAFPGSEQNYDDSNWASGQDGGEGTHRRRPSRGKGRLHPDDGITGSGRMDGLPPLSTSEQEDRDLALALQLQEEEEERHRVSQERRRREARLSEQFIEQQAGPWSGTRAGGGGVAAPPRQPARNAQVVRSLIPPDTPSDGARTGGRRSSRPGVYRAGGGGEDAPPSYEQARNDVQVRPLDQQPSHTPSPGPRRSSRAGGTNAASGRHTAVSSGSGTRDRDCLVM